MAESTRFSYFDDLIPGAFIGALALIRLIGFVGGAYIMNPVLSFLSFKSFRVFMCQYVFTILKE